MSYITVVGAGSWGTTLACLLATKGFDITLWVREKELADEMTASRTNSIYLPGVTLPDNIRITNSFQDALAKTRYVVNAIPAQYTRSVFKQALPYIEDEALIITVSKGIERGLS